MKSRTSIRSGHPNSSCHKTSHVSVDTLRKDSKKKGLPWKYCLAVSLLGGLVYINAIGAGFTYDDNRAIKDNQDLHWSTPLSSLLLNDYWGTPLTHSGSHKSYRPLTVLSFRVNFALHQLHPWGYHLVNVALHSIVCLLFARFSGLVFHGHVRPALTSSLIFACHPIHTEAVTSVVGRADVGAGLFFLLSLMFYMEYVRSNSRRCLILCPIFAAMSMLTKEIGITVLGVCGIYHVLIHHRLFPAFVSREGLQSILREKRFASLREGFFHLSGGGILLISLRLYLMGMKAPDFSPADNPASASDSLLTRTLTFWFLPVHNFYLLVFPEVLSFDWSMESIPLLTSLTDRRNILSLVFYSGLVILVRRLFWGRSKIELSSHAPFSTKKKNGYLPSLSYSSDVLPYFPLVKSSRTSKFTINNNCLLPPSCLPPLSREAFWSSSCSTSSKSSSTSSRCSSCSIGSEDSDYEEVLSDAGLMSVILLVVPFIPASNLFFYVGFVIAERVLYIPSMGYCLLIASGAEVLMKRKNMRSITSSSIATTTLIALSILLMSFSARTFVRNIDWASEENLYASGVAVNPPKAYGNLGNILSAQGRKDVAEKSYRRALSFRPTMADVHYNLGILLQEQGRVKEAAESYMNAIRFRPRLAVAHLNLGIVLTSMGKKEEAAKVYKHCAHLDGTGLKDPKSHENTKISALFNLGRLYADEGRYEDAVKTYQEAIRRMPKYYQSHSLYNVLGEALTKMGQYEEAEKWYKQALKSKADHVPAHLTLAKHYARMNRMNDAEKFFRHAMFLAPNDTSVYLHYGQFLIDEERFLDAVNVYQKAVGVAPHDFDVVFNAASALRQARLNEEAEKMYKQAVLLRPNEVSSHMNLGAMLHLNGKLSEAETEYLQALKIRPDDAVTRNNLAKLRSMMHRRSML